MRFLRPAIAFLTLSVLAALVILGALAVLRQDTEAAPTYVSGGIGPDPSF